MDTGRHPAATLLRRVGLGAIPFVLLLAVWHLASRSAGTLLPAIGEVGEVLAHPFREPPNLDSLPLATSALVSLLRVAFGFGAALVTAVPLGILVGCRHTARELFLPIVEMSRSISPVAWMPLTIILLGFSSLGSVLYGTRAWEYGLLDQVQLAIVAVIWWASFFPVFLNTMHGVAGVRRLFIEVALANGARRAALLRHVIVPAALPAIMVGIRLGVGRALMVIVAAEFFPGTRAGLGYFITTSHQVAQYEYALASVVVIGLVGLVVNLGLYAVESRVSHWQAKER
ncbi:MAG: ABC transporter permease [Planctomycetes bacterium]|nr:ABC transporter permease [Planctomycetota bacterium]